MKIVTTKIKDLLIIEPKVFEDERGYFYESYNRSLLQKKGLDHNYVQDNQSKSSYGVIRGLHYQLEPYAQTKLVRVLEGTVYDVAVDIRKGSPTFGQWTGLELSKKNRLQLLVPKGFAHGFSVLSHTAVVFYKCDDYYNPGSERGIIFNDKTLNIDWRIEPEDIIVSGKDRKHPTFEMAEI